MTAPATEVALRLPEDWIEVDPGAADLDGDLRRSLRERWDVDVDAAGGHVDQAMGPVVVELRRLAADPRVLLCGLYCRVVPVDGAAYPLVVTANAVLAVVRGGLDADLVRTGQTGWRTEPVDLPAGPAVVATGTPTLTNPQWPAPVPAFARRYFVAVPGADAVATLAFTTTNPELAEAFTAVFDAVAASVTFTP